jgi:SAM-dependent methyltransferase
MIKKVMTWSPWLVDQYNYVKLLFQILRKFHRRDNPWKVPTTSRDYYNAYDDKEQRRFVEGKLILCRDGGRNRWLPPSKATERYLEPIIREVEELLKDRETISILEVGCGNCINLTQLKKQFGPRLKLHGFDISSGRLAVAKKFFGEQLADISLWEESITEPTPTNEVAKYDLVYSMHCLEQIPFAAAQAVEGLWKRARFRVVMVEPVWEYARPVQKLKLVRSDYIRTLLPTVKYLGYNILRSEPLGFESSRKNQSSVIVLGK